MQRAINSLLDTLVRNSDRKQFLQGMLLLHNLETMLMMKELYLSELMTRNGCLDNMNVPEELKIAAYKKAKLIMVSVFNNNYFHTIRSALQFCRMMTIDEFDLQNKRSNAKAVDKRLDNHAERTN